MKNFEFNENEIRYFFHYPPSFYRLHLHVVHISNNNVDYTADRAHNLERIISNVSIMPDYY